MKHQIGDLSEKDVHCIARLLQGAIFNNSIFGYCQYCRNYEECSHTFPTMHFDSVREKLGDITGVHLGMLIPTTEEMLKKGN